jgi:hypothetical protein
MHRPPPRTSLTPLTDDVLLLFDALFDHVDVLDALRRDAYAACQNLPYTHGLDDAALDRTVEDLVRGGLLARRTERRGRTWYGLTEAGGQLWEAERTPRWERFCCDSWWPDEESGHWRGAVWSPQASTAEAYLLAARRRGLHAPDVVWEAPTLSGHRRLVPWKTFDTVYEVRLRLPRSMDEPGGVVDWAGYEGERTWWRSIGELATLSVGGREAPPGG